jgi:hypothetical protein
MTIAVALIGGLGGLVACGDDADDVAVSVPPAEGPSTTEPTDQTDPGAGAAQAVTPEPGVGENLRARPFDRAEVAADGATVDVYFYGGVAECYVVDRVEVDRTDPAAIELTLFEGGRPGADVCIEIAVAYVTTVSLDPAVDPTTPVVDGADGQVKS